MIIILLASGEMREVLVFELAAQRFGPQDVGRPSGLRGAASRASAELRETVAHIYLRNRVHRVHGQAMWRLERREQHLAEVVCTREEGRLAGKRVCGQQPSKVTNDGLKEWSVLRLQKYSLG